MFDSPLVVLGDVPEDAYPYDVLAEPVSIDEFAEEGMETDLDDKIIDADTIMPAIRAAAATCEADEANTDCAETVWHGSKDTEMTLEIIDAAGKSHWDARYVMEALAGYMSQQGILGLVDDEDDREGGEGTASHSRNFVLAA